MTSESHSHANQGWPAREKEKGSTRGTAPVFRIRSPVRICQPQSPSEISDCHDCGRPKAASTTAKKKTSTSEGLSRRDHTLYTSAVRLKCFRGRDASLLVFVFKTQ